MRFMLKVTIPTEAGNKMVADPSFGQTIQEVLSDIKAEAAYFSEEGGRRAFYVVVSLDGAHEIPNVAEPFFQGLNATVEFHPVMLAGDLAKAGSAIEKWAKRFS